MDAVAKVTPPSSTNSMQWTMVSRQSAIRIMLFALCATLYGKSHGQKLLCDEERFTASVKAILKLKGTVVNPEDLGRPCALRLVWLERCNVSDESMELFNGIASIETCNLNGNSITHIGLMRLSHITGLSTLDLSNTNISDHAMSIIGNHKSLRKIYINSTPVGDDGLAMLRDLPHLELISLDDTRVSNTGIGHLRSLKSLKILSISNNIIDGCCVATIRPILKELRELSISGPNIDDRWAEHVDDLMNLKKFCLSGSKKITKQSLPALLKMTNLEILQISQTSISEDEASNLEKYMPRTIIIR